MYAHIRKVCQLQRTAYCSKWAVRKKKAAISEAKRLRSQQLQDDSQLLGEPIEIDIDNEEDTNAVG
jgi:hypothetical protein